MVAVTNNNQTSAGAAAPAWNAGQGGVPAGFQQILAATLASATKLTVPTGAKLAVITVDGTPSGLTNGVRYRDDGGVPTAAAGIFIPPAIWPPFIYSADIANIQFIAVGTITAMNIAYYR